MADIEWQNVTVKLGQLDPWGDNPKTLSKARAKRLLAYWDKIGQFQTIAIGPFNGNGLAPLYDGHQRRNALLTVHGPDYEVAARQSSRALTEEERAEMVAQSTVGTVGSWDWDKIAAWDYPVQEWGLDGETLREWGTNVAALGAMVESQSEVPEFKEYDESIADEVEYITCPHCNMSFPK